MSDAPHAGPPGQPLRLRSAAFGDGDTIPDAYTCAGDNHSPPLAWSDVPAETRSFALLCQDPDAPRGTFTHWVLYNLPADAAELNEGLPTAATLPSGARQGVNDGRTTGYTGPCPPPGTPHRYYFTLYALNSQLNLPDGAVAADLLRAIEGHVVAEGTLMGRFGR